MTIGYTLFGSKISGAEKRVIKIALSNWFALERKSLLILNQSLLDSASLDTELGRLVEERASQIIIIKDRHINNLFRLAWIFITIKRRYKVNIFHAYLGARNKALLLTLFNIKVVYEITSPDFVDAFIENFSRRRKLYLKLYRVNCVSVSVYKKLVKSLEVSGYSRYNLKVSYNTVPYTRVDVGEIVDFDIKENVIICASRFIHRKHVVEFAEIAKKILKIHGDWTVKIFGHGPQEAKIKEILHDEIKNNQALVSYTTDIISYLKKSKIVCSLIEPDNFPSQTLFEALACGNALVVTNVGNSDVFVSGQNGVLSDDIESVFEDIIGLINNPEKLLEMQYNSRRYYINQFQEGKYFEELFKFCYK